MIITYLGHSCFKLEENGASLVTDPYGPGSVPGLSAVRTSAGQVICSHGHGDHNAAGEVKIIPAANSFDTELIHTFHDPEGGRLRGTNDIMIIKSEGRRYVHMGDIGCDPGDEAIGKIRNCDVLFIPVGGFFTIDHKEAMELIQKINPKITVPMHFRGKTFGYDVIAESGDFIRDAVASGKYKMINDGESVIDTSVLAAGTIVILKPLRS